MTADGKIQISHAEYSGNQRKDGRTGKSGLRYRQCKAFGKLFVRKAGYEARLKELTSAKLDIIEIQTCKRASDSVKSMIRDQMIAVHTAQRNLEMARKRLNEVMKERKTHENLKEKAFEAFKEELAAEEGKMTDELVSYTYHSKEEQE